MARTTSVHVAQIIEVDDTIDLDPFIQTAAALVDRVAASSFYQSSEKLLLIETWLAAHFYCMRDPRPVSEKAGSVGATYQSSVSLFLSTSHYGQMAVVLDESGTLRALSTGKKSAKVYWGGTEIE